jgi:hypothetical protein
MTEILRPAHIDQLTTAGQQFMKARGIQTAINEMPFRLQDAHHASLFSQTLSLTQDRSSQDRLQMRDRQTLRKTSIVTATAIHATSVQFPISITHPRSGQLKTDVAYISNFLFFVKFISDCFY